MWDLVGNPEDRFSYNEAHIFRAGQTQTGQLSYRLEFEPRCEKTCLRDFRPGPTQTRLYIHRRWLESGNFGFRKKMGFTIYVAKTMALISKVKKPVFPRFGSFMDSGIRKKLYFRNSEQKSMIRLCNPRLR